MIKHYLMYLRKSRSDGEETITQVLAKHETQLQEYCFHEFGEHIPEENIYREVVSGETIADRPEIQHVLNKIESGGINGVIAIEPQRFSRGDLVDCGTIINAFRYTNTLIYTPNMIYDLNNKMERKFFEQELMRGNDYLEYTKEILNRGRIASVKKGNFIGSVAPYGYRKVKYKDDSNNQYYYTLEIVPEEAAVIEAMYDAFANKGYGFAKTAQYLDSLGVPPRKSSHWSPAAIKDMLENPVYIGKIRWNWRKTKKVMVDGEITKVRPKSDESSWILVDGRHDAIISEELYHKALDRRGKNVRVKSKTKLSNPFAGLIFCQCGRAMTYRTYKDSSGNVRCAPRLLCNGQTYCKTKSCTVEDMRQHIIDSMRKNVNNFSILLENSKTIDYNDDLLKGLRDELKNIDELDEEQHDLLECKIYTRDVFLKRNAKLMERRKSILESIEKLESEKKPPIDYAERISSFNEAIDSLLNPDSTPERQNFLLKKCIRHITYHRPDSEHNKCDNGSFELKIEFIL